MSDAFGRAPRLNARITAFGMMLALSALLLALPQAVTDRLVDEHGPVESLSAVLWLVGAAAALLAARSRPLRREWLFGSVITMLFAARELSWHTAFTGWSVTRLETYTDPQVPLAGRVLALLVVVLPVVTSIIGLFVRMLPRLRRAWTCGAAWSRDVPLWFLLLISSQVLDKGHKVFPPLGLDIPVHYTRLFEESLEMTLAAYVVLTLWPLCFPRQAAPAAEQVEVFTPAISDERPA